MTIDSFSKRDFIYYLWQRSGVSYPALPADLQMSAKSDGFGSAVPNRTKLSVHAAVQLELRGGTELRQSIYGIGLTAATDLPCNS